VTPPVGSGSQGSPWLVLGAVMIGTLLVGLDRTIINLAVPAVVRDFDLAIPTAGWLATAYIITDSVFIPVFGKLGDMLGERRIYIWGMWGFLVTSLLCGLAWNFGVLVFFRTLQGLVGAAVFPTALALITRAFTDPGQRTQAFGIWSASFAVSIALGPLVGGPLIDNLSWRWIFYINFPISLIGLAVAYRWIAADARPARVSAFDWQGAFLLGAALTAVILVVERGREWGWASPGAYVCYVAAALAAVWFVAWQRTAPEPMIPRGLFRSRLLTISLVVSFVSFVAMVGTMFLLPVFAQQMLGYDATDSGLLLLPMAVTMMVVAPIGAKVTANLPLSASVAGGLSLAAVGIFLLSRVDVRATYLDLALPMVVLAIGLAPSFAALTAAATASVGQADIGVTSGILNLVRNMGAAVGIALFATVVDTLFETNASNLAMGSVVNQAPAMAEMLPTLLAIKAQIDAYGTVFASAGVVMALAVLSSLALGRISAGRIDGPQEATT
jgi:EmrB/QacA subfamily drug resistance transporter